MDDDENEREKTERKNNFYVFFLVGSTKTADIAKVAMEERGEGETLLNEVHSCPRIKHQLYTIQRTNLLDRFCYVF